MLFVIIICHPTLTCGNDIEVWTKEKIKSSLFVSKQEENYDTKYVHIHTKTPLLII